MNCHTSICIICNNLFIGGHFTDKPKVTVKLDGGISVVLQQSSFEVVCSVDANPQEITWKKNSLVLEGESSLTLSQPGGIVLDTVYECEVENSIDRANGVLSVSVHCKCQPFTLALAIFCSAHVIIASPFKRATFEN